MRLLLDTHALLWWAHDPAKLSDAIMTAIRDGENEVFVSAVSAMEIATKARKGKLEYDSSLAYRFIAEVISHGFGLVPISCEHAERAGGYVSENQDPWDRLLAAQSQMEGLTLVSRDEAMGTFGISPIWQSRTRQ